MASEREKDTLYNPAFQAGFEIPLQETLAELKVLYEDTGNPLFAWEAFRITAPLGISEDWVQHYLLTVAFGLVERAKMSLREDESVFKLDDVPKQLRLTDKKSGPGRLRAFALYLRDAWFYRQMQRRIEAGEVPKQAKHAVALAQGGMWGSPLTEDRIERIWSARRQTARVTPNRRRKLGKT